MVLYLLFQEKDVARALDFLDKLAVKFGGHAGNAAREDAAFFGHKLLEQFGVFEINRLGIDINTTLGRIARIAAASVFVLRCC